MKQKSITKRIRKYYKYKIMPRLQKAIGMDELEDNIYYFLNSATDISACRPATGFIRSLQIADAELLKIIDLLCRQNNLQYWLDWGSLLGAVRHKGFVPWDDDLDICLPLDDYRKLYQVLQSFCVDHKDFILSSQTDTDLGWMWVNYRANGTHIDIYPICHFFISKGASAEQIQQAAAMHRENADACPEADDKTEHNNLQRIYYYPKSVWGKITYFPSDEIFPLLETPFEEFSFFVPKDSDKYLTKIYGDYMSYPRNCVLKHKLLLEAASKIEKDQFFADYDALKKIRVSLENNAEHCV